MQGQSAVRINLEKADEDHRLAGEEGTLCVWALPGWPVKTNSGGEAAAR